MFENAGRLSTRRAWGMCFVDSCFGCPLKNVLFCLYPVILFVIFFGITSPAWAVVTSLVSAALRVELISSPYSYRVIERSTGEVLVSQSDTALAFGAELYPVADAKDVTTSSDS